MDNLKISLFLNNVQGQAFMLFVASVRNSNKRLLKYTV